MNLIGNLTDSAKRCAGACLFALSVLAGLTVSCASDNIHMPETGEQSVPPQNTQSVVYDGTLTTSIPDMPAFEPVTVNDYVKLSWSDSKKGMLQVEVGAFDIQVEMMASEFHIGTMHIEDVKCTVRDNGESILEEKTFECQAGQYLTKGSLSGRLYADRFELTLHYKPGSMPFECKSVFQGTTTGNK